MKKNGLNIITDEDISLSNQNIGETLSEVLDKHNAKLNQLESNIKWIYKNGGIGTGSAPGSGSVSSSWKIVVTKGGPSGDILTNNSTINLSGIGNYTFSVQIYGGGQSSFKVTSTYINSKGTQMNTQIITSSDGFLWQKSLYLDLNGNISISVLNQDTQEIETFIIPFIVVSHSFSLNYVYKDTKTVFSPSNNTIFMNDVKNNGLMAALTYSIAVDLSNSGYSYSDWEGYNWSVSQETGIIRTAPDGSSEIIAQPGEVPADKLIQSKSSNTIYIDLTHDIDIIDFLNDNLNAKYTQFMLNVDITLDGNITPESINEMSLKDNLIPAGMFLKLTTSAGTLYENRQLNGDNTPNYPLNGQFSLGSAIFNLTPYYGSLDVTRRYNLEISEGPSKNELEIIDSNITQLSDQQQQSLSVPITYSGEHYIQFRISAEQQEYIIGYWIYVKESTSTFNWFPTNIEPVTSSYYRRYNEDKNIDISSKTALNVSVNNTSNIVCKFLQNEQSSYNEYDQLLSIGLQYSKINELAYPICSLSTKDNGYKWAIFIYQNKIVISTSNEVTFNENNRVTNVDGQSTEIFFPMSDVLSDENTTSFHQLSIYRNFEKRTGNNYYKGIYIYIDGILEASFTDFATTHFHYDKITLYPGNYKVNDIEYHCFRHSDESTTKTWLSDNDFIGYYYTYYEKLLGGAVDEQDKILYDAFSNFTYDSNNFIKTDSTTINNIAKNSKVPVLVLSFTDTAGRINDTYNGFNKDNFKDWVSAQYSENDEIEELSVTAQWSDGTGTELSTISKNGSSASANFSLTLQGSSTMGYRCKNFELIAPESNDSSVCLFTPNFDPNDSNTFLPEESFTLKADVVDSSHTNNNAMGKFINDITTPFALAKQSRAKYGDFIKNCLTGFPVLLFIHTRYKEDRNVADANIENYYFFGIYNFNLGRKSYFNLGYKDLTKLETLGLTTGFHIYEIEPENNGILSSVSAAEIQGNNAYFDFSQYDPSILYSIGDGDETYMFGDFVDGVSGSSGQYANVKNKIASFVQRIALAGGYTFKAIGKTFSTSDSDSYGYNDKYSATDENGVPKNQVPNYLYQAVRSKSGTSTYYDFTQLSDEATEKDLKELLLQDESGESTATVGLDYRALCEYYTICMAFGLVDSVQKNLNIKSWNSGEKFYPAFYDMDTCLGVSNSGAKISYFAFSDYWETSIDKNKYLNEAKVWRDFSPNETKDSTNDQETAETDEELNSAFFDVPSSYLFAIAKYAYSILKNDDLLMHPTNLWGLWRNSSRNDAWSTYDEKQKGCLSDASYFINTYYKGHMANIPLSAFNYNYKYKYFVLPQEDSIRFDSTNFPKFYGRKAAYTENWLNGRFHILDAYFNLNGLSDVINPANNIVAPMPNDRFIDRNNNDIYVLKDIFSTSANGNQYSNVNAVASIQAQPYSPLIIKTSNVSHRYILPENGDVCNLTIKTSGNQYSLFGGSSLWTYLSSINPFITSEKTLYIDSANFTSLKGTSGTCQNWTMKTPSIKDISLTSRNYSGELIFRSTGTTDNFPNLKTINVSGTSLQLTIDTESPTKLTATNMLSGSKIDISNVSTLTEVSLSGTMSSLNIPAWKSGILLPTTYTASNNASWACNTITIKNDISKYPNNTLTIRNNSTLTSLNFSGFSTVYVYNCPKLETVNVDDTNVLSKLYISGSASTFKIGAASNVADLSLQTKLSDLYLKGTSMEKIKLPNRIVNFLDSAFSGCDKLKYIEGDGQYFITGASTFYNCLSWTYRQKDDEEGKAPIFAHVYVKSTCTNLTNTFHIENTAFRGAIDLKAAKYFLTECTKNPTNASISASQVTNVENLFRNQNIHYPITLGFEEYKNGMCSLPLENFSKTENINGVFYHNSIDFYNKFMFKGLCSNGNYIRFNSLTPIGGNISNTTNNRPYTSGATPTKITYATLDMFEFIADKLVQINFLHNGVDNTPLCFISDKNGTTIDTITGIAGLKVEETILLGDLFRGGGNVSPKWLREINGLEIFRGNTIDFQDCFSTDWSYIQPNAERGLILGTFLYYGTYSNVLNIDGLFSKISIESISTSLNNVTAKTDDSTGYIDIAKFINFGLDDDEATKIKRLSKMTSLFGSHDYPSLSSLKKKISYDDFQSIWANILKYASKLTGLYKLFSNCIIITTSNPDEFSLVDEMYTGITNTSIVNIDYLFQNCKLRNSVTSKTDMPFKISHDFLKFLPNIKSVRSTFTGMLWDNPVPFDFFHKREESIIDVYVGEDRRPANLFTYSYINNMTDLYGCFSNVTMSNSQCFDPYANYNKGSFKRNRIVTYDIDGNEIDEGVEYYESISSNRKLMLMQPSEITDTENIHSNYTQRSTIKINNTSHTLTNLPNTKSDGCFVAPDIFYGVISTCNIQACFKNDSIESICFTGIIPDHLLKYCINTPITNLMQGLNITPKLYKLTNETDHEGNVTTSYYYYYIPVHFTESTSLSNSFNFNFIIPPVSTAYTKYYYCLLLNGDNEKSIPTTTASLYNAFPGSGNVYSGINGQATGFPNYCAGDSQIYYAIMGTPNEEVIDNELTFVGMDWGLDMMTYSSLKLDNIYNTPNMWFMIGNVIKEGTISTWNKNLLSDTNNAFIYTNANAGTGGISYNAKIEPPLYIGSGYLRISGSGNKIVNANSIIGYNPDNLEKYKAYYPGFNVY